MEGRPYLGDEYGQDVELRDVPSKVGRQWMWKLESWVAGAVGAFLAQVLLRKIFGTIRKDKSASAVFNADSKGFSWPDAALWAVAGGFGLAAAKIASARVAAIGWRMATGTAPPGAEDETD